MVWTSLYHAEPRNLISFILTSLVVYCAIIISDLSTYARSPLAYGFLSPSIGRWLGLSYIRLYRNCPIHILISQLEYILETDFGIYAPRYIVIRAMSVISHMCIAVQAPSVYLYVVAMLILCYKHPQHQVIKHVLCHWTDMDLWHTNFIAELSTSYQSPNMSYVIGKMNKTRDRKALCLNIKASEDATNTTPKVINMSVQRTIYITHSTLDNIMMESTNPLLSMTVTVPAHISDTFCWAMVISDNISASSFMIRRRLCCLPRDISRCTKVPCT
jgi:hypothetical protein